MTSRNSIFFIGLLLACWSLFSVIPAHAFTADSLDITVSENGDAVATFRYTLEGLIENAIPQSMLEQELKKGLTTSSEPPELQYMDRSSAQLLLRDFAQVTDVPTGRNYLTVTMDFKKAEIALQNSAVSGVVSADFSPARITVTFPDSYKKEYTDIDVLPAISHIIEDPEKVAQLRAEEEAAALLARQQDGTTPAEATTTALPTDQKGSINVTSYPDKVRVLIDSQYVGEAPGLFSDIPAGTHTMEFSRDGYSPATKTVIVNAGKTTNILVVLSLLSTTGTTTTASTPFPWVPVLVVLLGLIVIGIGAYYFMIERKTKGKKVPGAGTRQKAVVVNDRGLPKIVIDDRVSPGPVAAERVPVNTAVPHQVLPGPVTEGKAPAPVVKVNPVPPGPVAENTVPPESVIYDRVIPEEPVAGDRPLTETPAPDKEHKMHDDDDTGDECR